MEARIRIGEGGEVSTPSHLLFVDQHEDDVFGVNLRPILEPQALDGAVASLRSVLEDNGLLTAEVEDDLLDAHARAADASDGWPDTSSIWFGGMLDHAHLHVHLQTAEAGGWFYTISLVRPEYAGPEAADLQTIRLTDQPLDRWERGSPPGRRAHGTVEVRWR